MSDGPLRRTNVFYIRYSSVRVLTDTLAALCKGASGALGSGRLENLGLRAACRQELCRRAGGGEEAQVHGGGYLVRDVF